MTGLERELATAVILSRHAAGEVSGELALMELLILTEDLEVLEHTLEDGEIKALMRAHRAGCATIAAMLKADVDRPPRDASIEEGVAFARALFDWSVQQSEEASVALYSLGSPEVLGRATEEIVTLLDAWGVLSLDRAALDLGCGIGRMERALASRLRSMTAIDVSKDMLTAARRRCADLTHVTFASCSGLDLEGHEDDTYDLVLAVDSVPYLVQAGMPLVEQHFADVRRVLRPGGDFFLASFSYRGSAEEDIADVARLAAAAGLELVVSGARPFRLWDALVFLMRKSPTR